MKQSAFNPYLPSWEYIPDGEPHVFGERVYVYGSHDAFGAPIFCVNDYVCWSAPVDDLSDWRFEGVIYRKTQDPGNRLGLRSLYAPDVTQGPDGRYYLYYAFDFLGEIGVAVFDTPAGKYEFYGKVHHRNGRVWGRRSGEAFPFDPGVLTDDDGRVWLYSGFAIKVPFVASRFHKLRSDGGVVLELEPDMVTIKQEPKLLFPRKGLPGAFPHAFFEASSIRKVDGKYCFVYSSEHNHALCYALSDYPDRDFTYGGVLIDLGDLYRNGNEDESRANNYLGNTHGGLLHIGDDWYIFYHRQTNRSSYARQACAEKLERRADGGFQQAEVTSCGFNGGPLVLQLRYCKQEDRTMAFQLRPYHAPNFTEERFVIAPQARLTPAPSDGIAPVGCHAMSIFPEYFKIEGSWRFAEESRMDCVAIWEDEKIKVIEFRNLKKGQLVVMGRSEDGSEGIYVHPGAFRHPGEGGHEETFAFRQKRSRETAFSRDYDELYEILKHDREHGKIVWVMGPALAFDYDARDAFSRLIENGYVDALLAGNALATHDLEAAWLKTALGQNIYTQAIQPNGHYNHLDTINRVRACGSIRAFLEQEGLEDGIMAHLEKRRVPYVLAGSIRDDGPLPEVTGNVYEAQNKMRDQVRGATTVICLATMLHSIAVGNMTPSYRVMPDGTIREVYFYCVDISEFTANKLGDRGSLSAKGIVTNVQDFIVTLCTGLGI